MSFWDHWLRVVLCVGAGIPLCFIALFTEAHDRRLQTWLEATWVRADDVSTRVIGRHTKAVKNAVGTSNALLDGLYGARLLSVRVIAMSATLGLSVILMFSWDWAIVFLPTGEMEHTWYPPTLRVIGFFIFAFALLPAMLKPGAVPVWSVLILLFWIYWVGIVAVYPLFKRDASISPFILALLLGLVCDVVLVLAARRLFRAMMWTESGVTLAFLWFAGVCVAVVSIALPVLPVLDLWVHGSYQFSLALAFTGLTNVVGAVLILFPAIVMALLLVHHFLWPLVKQPLYAAQRYEIVIRHKRLILIAGIALVTFGTFGTPSWLSSLLGYTR